MKTSNKKYLLQWNLNRFDFIEVELKSIHFNKAVVQVASDFSFNLLFVNYGDVVEKTKENKKILIEMRKMSEGTSRKLIKMQDKLIPSR